MKTLKNESKSQCTCGTGTPCSMHEQEKACTCGTGTRCYVHEKEQTGKSEAKMYGGCCQPSCGPGVCK